MSGAVKQMFPAERPEGWEDWRWQWRNRITDPAVLLRSFPGSPLLSDIDTNPALPFRFAVTPYYLSLADARNPRCPILGQVTPRLPESEDVLFPDPDPLAEERHTPVAGLTHRYPDRVLWYLSHNCAVYCRFCMRKRKVSRQESAQKADAHTRVLEYVAAHPGIKEVILSGGDPLSASDGFLERTLRALRTIPHLRSLRIHTRMPVTLPQRFTGRLLCILEAAYPLTLVTHFNHSVEITAQSREVIRALRMRGVLVLNQAVLLRGINDSLADQESLHLDLISAGIKPYYLHQCDEVQGVSHFRTPLETGLRIMKGLRGRNPGIALPTYVIDLPGGGGKIPAESAHLTEETRDGRRVAISWSGAEHTILADD